MNRDAPSVERSIAWNLTAGPLIIAGNLVLIPVAIHVAGAPEYGGWLLCFGVVSLFAVADLGLGAGLIRQLAVRRAQSNDGAYEAVARIGFRIFLGLALGLGAITPIVLGLYFQDSHALPDPLLNSYILLASAGVVATLLARYFVALQHANGQYLPERLLAIAGLVVRGSTLIFASTLEAPATAIAASEVAAIVLTLVGSAFIVRRKRMLSYSTLFGPVDREETRVLIAQSVPSFVASFATLLAMNAPLYIVGIHRSLSEAAIFGAITRVYTSGRTLLGWGSLPMLPAASAAAAVSTRSLRPLFQATALICSALGLALAAPLVVFPDVLLALWLDRTDSSLHLAFALIGIAIYVHSRYAPAALLAIAIGKPAITATSNLLWLAITVALGVVLVPVHGSPGAALSVLVPAAITLEWAQWRVCVASRVPYVRPFWQTWGRFIVSVLCLVTLRGLITWSGLPLLPSSLVAILVWSAGVAYAVKRSKSSLADKDAAENGRPDTRGDQ